MKLDRRAFLRGLLPLAAGVAAVAPVIAPRIPPLHAGVHESGNRAMRLCIEKGFDLNRPTDRHERIERLLRRQISLSIDDRIING